MPSPDVSAYADLTLYDRTPAQIADDAITYAQVVLPEFNPKRGSVEDAVVQATSLMTSQLMGAINRMTPGVLEIVLQLFGITRISGTQAAGSVQITLTDTLGHTVPTGTRFGYMDRTDPENPILFAFDTDVDLVVPVGASSGTVAITGTTYESYPALLAGQAMQLLTPVSFILSTQLVDNMSVGLDPESDAAFFARAVSGLNSYSAGLTLPSQMVQYVLKTYTDVYRCTAYSRVNSANDDWNDAAENGYVTVYASKAGGASLSTTSASVIAEDLMDRSTAGLVIDVKAPLLVPILVETTVVMKSGQLSLDVQAAIEAALAASLDANTWMWGETIYYNEVISLIDQAVGVERVSFLEVGGATTDYTFTRRGSLPVLTSLITVV